MQTTPTSGYAGDVSARDAWQALTSDPAAVLIDVRTAPEWAFVGVPDLQSLNKQAALISWKVFPTMSVNPQFADQLSEVAPDREAPLYFLCKTGGRSLDAACFATAHGYRHCFNIADGFEGPLDARCHRSTQAGWRADALPWVQQ